jgi:hypothetical protein
VFMEVIGAQSHGEHNKIWEEWVGQPHRCVAMSANSTSATCKGRLL